MLFTVAFTLDTFDKAAAEILPHVDRFSILDDRIPKFISAAGRLTPEIHSIVAGYVRTAETEGADAVLVTCSSISPCVDTVRPFVSIPVMKVDDPMTDMAVERASKIGVIATAMSTLEPTKNLLLRKAEARGKMISIKSDLCQGAIEALYSNDTTKHDELVLEGIRRIARQVDLVVLAQASMARVVPRIGEEVTVPILTSIRSGVDQVRKVLAV